MECKYFEDATIFDCDFNEIEYKYCMLFDDECKKARRKKDCLYRLHKQLKRKEQENAELKEIIDSLLIVQYAIAANATKLEQTLTAIKEIAEEISKEKVHDPDIDKILDLIKESEVENE